MAEARKLTEDDGYEALREHLIEKASLARQRHGPDVDLAAIEAILADRELVRFPAEISYDAAALLPGEFAHAEPLGESPGDGFRMVVHPHYEGQADVVALLVAYHIPSINYLDVVTHVECELYGATLLGLEVDDYYRRLCALADAIPGNRSAPPG